MVPDLPDVTHLQGGIGPELVLNCQVPLVRNGGLYVWIPKAENGPAEASVIGAREARRRRCNNSLRRRR